MRSYLTDIANTYQNWFKLNLDGQNIPDISKNSSWINWQKLAIYDRENFPTKSN